MSTSLLYHTQNIRDYQYISTRYSSGYVIWNIISKNFRCNHCFSPDVTVSLLKKRLIRAGRINNKLILLNVSVHRIYCPECKKCSIENISFLPSPKARITKSLERSIIELRSEMSISAISEYFGLDWKTVKDCEKKYLGKKFSRIPLKHVKTIGIDELYVKSQGNEKYITIVRDIESGSVLFVGNGKGVESLSLLGRKLKRSKSKITTVAMDMSKSYISWVKEVLPEATIVFDHFHVIKLMNEKLDKVRRRTALNLDDEQRKLLKNQRFLFLRNVENLEGDAKQLLDNLQGTRRCKHDERSLEEYLSYGNK